MGYRFAVLHRGRLESEDFFDSIKEVKDAIKAAKTLAPTFIQRYDINVEDLDSGVTYTVDQKYKLVEM